MTRRRWAFLLISGLLLAGQSPASAQPPARARVPTPGGEVTVLADRLEESGPDNLLVATGNVEITHGTARLIADRIEINRQTGDAVAQGRVVFYDGEDRLSGERIDYNVRTGTGVVHRGEARAAPYYRVSGERLERLGESVYRVHRGIFTTCDSDTPEWSFRFGSATADLDDYVFGTNASFWVKNLPLIPWVPFFAAAIRRERQTGFLFPKLGTSSRKGVFAEIPFFWAISDSQDATIALDMFERRGVGASAEYRYAISTDQRGGLTGFYLRETQRDDADRAVGGLKHEWQIAPGLSLYADIHGVSDDRVLREYGDLLHQRSAQRAESNVFLTRTWENWNVVGNLFWYQDLTTRRPVELQRLPDVQLHGTRQPLPGLPGVLYQLDASATHFVRDVGSDGTRVDVHPRVSRPFSPGGVVTVTPFVGGRVTAYDKTLAGTRQTLNEGHTVEVTEDDARIRRFLEIGTDLESRASRAYRLDGRGGLDSAIHSIEPRVNYTWITGENHGRVPIWTEAVDRIPESSRIEYSVINRIRARTVSGPDAEAVRWELGRLLLGHSYDLKNERPGNLVGDLIVQPNGFLRGRAEATYAVERDRRREISEGFQTAITDLSVALGRVSGSVGTRYQQHERVSFLQGGLSAEIVRNLAVRAATNWDLRTETFVENRIGVDLRFDCWALSLDYIARHRDEDEFRFSLNLLGLGGPIRTAVGVGDAARGGR